MRKIAIYGKGGIGKSTTTSNIAAAFSEKGLSVLQIGCDPKSDSTKNLTGGKKIKSVLDAIREKEKITADDVLFRGYNGIWCVEAGGPTPGIGCAGRGIITAFEKLEELGAYEICKPDIVLYDVLGDVVCGGFAMPIRGGYARNVFIVTSGEMMSLYAASNIASAVKNFGKRGYAQYSGVILNSRNLENEEEIVRTALKEIGGDIVSVVPRCPVVQEAENQVTMLLLGTLLISIVLLATGPISKAFHFLYGIAFMRFVLLFLIMVLFFMAIYMIVPRERITYHEALQGAFITSGGIVILYIALNYYFKYADFTSLYGPLTSICVILFVFDWASEIFYVGMYLTHIAYLRRNNAKWQEKILERVNQEEKALTTTENLERIAVKGSTRGLIKAIRKKIEGQEKTLTESQEEILTENQEKTSIRNQQENLIQNQEDFHQSQEKKEKK